MQRMRIGWQNYRVYLTAGENSLYCGAARLTPSGWDIIFMGDAISCADGESVHVGNWCPGSLNKIIGQEIIFGRVDDPNIALLTIEEWGGRDWTKPGCENEKLRRPNAGIHLEASVRLSARLHAVLQIRSKHPALPM